jgi:outer membrane murein-binding lipoprotein Lpp
VKIKFGKFGYIIVSLVMLSGCASLSERECLEGDWFKIGVRDGQRGYRVDRLDTHEQACAKYGVASDEQTYFAGHAEGLLDYCQPQNGYREGFAERDYDFVCPIHMEKAFLREYAKGLSDQIRELDYVYDLLQRDLDHARYDALYLKSEDQRERARYEADKIESELRSVSDRRFQLNTWLRQALDRI